MEAKKSVWMSKLPRLTDGEVRRLASAYDFSGGQIDNIVRKSLMEGVIKGEAPSLVSLMGMFERARISGDGRVRVWF